MDPNVLQEAARRAQGTDPASARPLVAQLIAARPHDPDVLTIAGIVAQRTGDAASAIDAFARACAADPANPARLGNHALALKAAGRCDEAIDALKDADRIRPGNAITLTNLGSCLIEAHRAVEAEAPLRAAIAVRPEHAEAWNNLGIALARTGRADQAVAAYRRALALRSGWIEATLNLVDSLVASGALAEADGLARRALVERPGHPRAANQLASLAETRGDHAEALRIYRDALRHGFSHPLAYNLALILLAQGMADEAHALAERMISESPSVTTPLALSFAALRQLGRDTQAALLADLDRFLIVDDVAEVGGFPSLAGFHAALGEELSSHPSLRFEPEGLVTRNGRQSDDLAQADTPAIAALARLAREHLAAHHARLSGHDHPWLRARPAAWSLTLWGTILSPGGAVESHIHAPNWLSGVYYPDLPGEVAGGREGGFGMGGLPAALGANDHITTVAARPGRLILFPSFLWHATLPFDGPGDRLSFAFDLVPAGTGRPHRLA